MLTSRITWIIKFFYLLCSVTLTTGVLADDPQPLIYIDTSTLTLTVVANGKTTAVFENISLGKGGTTHFRKRGDATTPLGQFRITWINRKSRYNLFFGLDFPNMDYALRAYEADLIDEDEFHAIKTALRYHKTPPQNTKLGGHIGIHGIGSGDARLHKTVHWTDGCVALTNEQINKLAKWIQIGTKVIITAS